VDLKKEIKLSDLLPGRKNKDTAAEEPKAEKKERKPLFGRKPRAEKPPKEQRRKADKSPKAKRHTSVGRKKKLVGLKVGASQIAAAQVVNNGGAQVMQVAREDLERGVVVGGELRDPDTLAAALRTFFRKNKLSRQNVRLGISNNRIGVRMFEIGGIDDTKQLANAIRYRAQEVLPIPLEEAVLDYHILGEETDGEGHTKHRVLLVVAYRDLVDRYTAACKKAGIRLAGIDLEAFAILRALAPESDGAA
jgi:type IV pilus assembly protein PilM